MNSVIIGFGHKRHQGKDEAVQHIIKTFDERYVIKRYAFADALKAEVFDAAMDVDHPYWGFVLATGFAKRSELALPLPITPKRFSYEMKWNWINYHKTEYGKFLQHYGTEYMRAKDPFHWISKTQARIEQDHPDIALISDMRFQNEWLWVKDSKGFTVKITRHGYVPNDGRDSNHPSETALDGWSFDYEVNVLDGELEQLHKDAVFVMEHIIESLSIKVPEGLPAERNHEVYSS